MLVIVLDIVSQDKKSSNFPAMGTTADAKSLLVEELLENMISPNWKVRHGSIQWILSHFDDLGLETLQRYYAFFIQRLTFTQHSRKALLRLVIKITDSRVVTQSCVRKLVSVYRHTRDPIIGTAVQTMRLNAGPNIYFPPTGQKYATQAQIPRGICENLRHASLQELSPINTHIYVSLVKSKSEAQTSAILTQVLPLSIQTSQCFLAVEQFTYEYLQKWDGTYDFVVRAVLPFFRVWPNIAQLEALLFEPLMKTHTELAGHIVYYLSWFKKRALPYVERLLPRLNSKGLVFAWLYYKICDVTPAAGFVERLIVESPGGIFLAEKWADQVPHIKRTLAGDYSLATENSVPDQDVIFALGNNPWIGTLTLDVFRDLTSRTINGYFTIDQLSDLGVNYRQFCNALLDELESRDLSLNNYLS